MKGRQAFPGLFSGHTHEGKIAKNGKQTLLGRSNQPEEYMIIGGFGLFLLRGFGEDKEKKKKSESQCKDKYRIILDVA